MADPADFASLDAFLDAEDFEASRRNAAMRVAFPVPDLSEADDDGEDSRWARQLRSTRACSQTKI